MKYLKHFNKINESHKDEDVVDFIVDTMRDFLDDDRKIEFKSVIGDMNWDDYVKKNSNYLDFRPIYNTGHLIRSQFSIVFRGIKDYKDFLCIVSDMQSVIGKFNDEDWSMFNMELETSPPIDNQGDVTFIKLIFYFSKADEKTGEEFKYPTKDDLDKIFKNWGLNVEDIDFRERSGDSEGEMEVEFTSNYLHGEIPDSVEKCFELVCDRFGFSSFSFDRSHQEVSFFYEL